MLVLTLLTYINPPFLWSLVTLCWTLLESPSHLYACCLALIAALPSLLPYAVCLTIPLFCLYSQYTHVNHKQRSAFSIAFCDNINATMQCYSAILQYTENTHLNVISTLCMQCYSAIFQYTKNTYLNVISTLCMQWYSAILQYTRTRILTLILMLQCSAIAQYCSTLKIRILTLFLHCVCSDIAQYCNTQEHIF